MRLFFRRYFLTGVWLYSLLLFFQSCREINRQAPAAGHIWQGALPLFALIGGLSLLVAAVLLAAINFPAGEEIINRVRVLRDRAGGFLLGLAVLIVVIAAIALIKNPWPWIFRWPYTRQFVFVYAAAASIILAFPWLARIFSALWPRLELVDLRAERVFTGLAVSVGLVYFILIPPFMAPDEFVHVYRAWAVSEGVLFVDHATIPASFTPFFDVFLSVPYHFDHKMDTARWVALLRQPLRADQRMEITYSSAAVYPPLVYFPQAAGIALGRWLNMPPLVIYYLGRLANFLVWMLMVRMAIRITPVYQWAFLVLAFLPMTFYMALSLSPDAVTNGSAFLFAAVILRLAFGEPQSIQRKELVWLAGSALLVAATKIPYFVLVLAFFIIPWKKFGSRRRYILTAAVFLAIIIGVIALLNLTAYSSLESMGQARKIPPLQVRLAEILVNPGQFAQVITNTFQMHYAFLYRTYLGVLGWLDTPLPAYAYTVISVMLIATALVGGVPGVPINIQTRLFFLALSTGVMLLIMVLIYLTFSPVGINFVYGLQGRYFIPIGPFIFLALYNRKLSAFGKPVQWLILVYLAWLFVQVGWEIVIRFYQF